MDRGDGRTSRAATSLRPLDVLQLRPELTPQLEDVEPSVDDTYEYRPCRVKLADGGWRDRVYVGEAFRYIQRSLIWPWNARVNRYIPLDNVSAIESSPTRIPANLASKIYSAGESGMGYCIFTLITDIGRRIPRLTGNAVDWIDLPSGIEPHNLVDVLPHEGPRDERLTQSGPPYSWCLYR